MHARTRRALHLLTATGAMTLALTFAGQSLAQADDPGRDRDRSSSWDGQRWHGDRSRDDAAPPPAPAPAPAPAPTPAPAPDPTGTGEQAYKDYAAAKVASAAQFDCLDALWEAESSWRPTAQNPTSTAYGIAQFLNGTWAGTGIAKTSDPFGQIDAGLVYIEERYGSPCAAWDFHQSNNWY